MATAEAGLDLSEVEVRAAGEGIPPSDAAEASAEPEAVGVFRAVRSCPKPYTGPTGPVETIIGISRESLCKLLPARLVRGIGRSRTGAHRTAAD